MAIQYLNQSMVETMSKKTGVASYRASEQRQILYGGRGSKYDELVYLRGQNTDTAAVNTRRRDAMFKFGKARSAGTANRQDQIEREFFIQGTFP